MGGTVERGELAFEVCADLVQSLRQNLLGREVRVLGSGVRGSGIGAWGFRF